MHPAELGELEALRDLYAAAPVDWHCFVALEGESVAGDRRPLRQRRRGLARRAGFEAQYLRPNYLSTPEADTSGTTT
jgi:hypothetical protein